MPKGTEVQVGFFCPQSKHIYRHDGALSISIPTCFHCEIPYLVRWLRLQPLEDLQRLLLGREGGTHRGKRRPVLIRVWPNIPWYI